MQLNANHAKEFIKIMGISDLSFQTIDPNGNFLFTHKTSETASELQVDAGTIASLVQTNKSVSRGETPEEALKKQIEVIRAELKI